jgi:hypothetical protein
LYGYENWSLTLREENRLKVLKNRMLRERYKSGTEVSLMQGQLFFYLGAGWAKVTADHRAHKKYSIVKQLSNSYQLFTLTDPTS